MQGVTHAACCVTAPDCLTPPVLQVPGGAIGTNYPPKVRKHTSSPTSVSHLTLARHSQYAECIGKWADMKPDEIVRAYFPPTVETLGALQVASRLHMQARALRDYGA